jgi:hypothetical protein
VVVGCGRRIGKAPSLSYYDNMGGNGYTLFMHLRRKSEERYRARVRWK